MNDTNDYTTSTNSINTSLSITATDNSRMISPKQSKSQKNFFSTIRKSEEVILETQQAIVDFQEKDDILSTYFEVESLKNFFRTIFPEGTLQEKGNFDEKKPNAIIMSNSTRLKKNKKDYAMKPYLIFDELDNLDCFKDAEAAYFVPATYFGGRRLNTNARRIQAMTFDIDGVTPKHLRNIIYQIEQNLIPKPTYITNSGNGLHLYYVLKYPVSASGLNLQELTIIKRALTDILWNPYTSNDPETEYQSITQGFRLPTSATKFGKGFNAKVYRVGEVVTLHELMSYLKYQAETIKILSLEPILQRDEKDKEKQSDSSGSIRQSCVFDSDIKKIKRIQTEYNISHLETKSRISLKEAKDKYSDWYTKRIVEKQPIGS